MSNLAAAAHLRQPVSQFPSHWYCDPRVHDVEMRSLFARAPGYVGHQLMVPEVGDYYALPGRHDAQSLVRNADGIELLSNVCRHRQALMLKGRGNAPAIVCPIHRWTYDLKGELIGAPQFAQKPCASLGRTPMQNWKTFIEVYLEDYHVGPFHPGLGKFVTVDDLKWEFAPWASLQTVGLNAGLAKAGTKTYERWHKAVLEFYRGEIPRHGAIWLTYYPNVMVEWYPHVLVISTLYPRAVDKTLNVVEFYYPEEIALFEREFVEAEQAAYKETSLEDDEIGERMDAGRKALVMQGRSEVGPYQSPMEDGMQHFHEFYRREMERELGAI